MHPSLELTRALIVRESVTPEDAGCQDLLIQRLATLGFEIERLPFGKVSNFWARYGTAEPLLVFAGHTDVVPPGPAEQWSSPPFEAVERDGLLYGRGTADMKGSLAAMVCACEAYLADAAPAGSIGFLITSDEEGIARDGTARVVNWLQSQAISIDYCIVGEPSSTRQLGDTIKIGRRGSLSGKLIVNGTQGHVAYPHLADNPIHRALSPLLALTRENWDQGNADFPPTSLQISNIHGGSGVTNVIPGSVQVDFNLRYSTELDEQQIQERCAALFEQADLDFSIDWHLSGRPFLTPSGDLIRAASRVIETQLGIRTELSTAGGTSDGRFIAPTGAQVIELGPCNASIHQVDEHVSIADLEALTRLYHGILDELL